jgi:hypothetical protein
MIQRGHALNRIAGLRDLLFYPEGQLLDPANIALDIKLWILDPGEGERRPQQVNALIFNFRTNQRRKSPNHLSTATNFRHY